MKNGDREKSAIVTRPRIDNDPGRCMNSALSIPRLAVNCRARKKVEHDRGKLFKKNKVVYHRCHRGCIVRPGSTGVRVYVSRDVSHPVHAGAAIHARWQQFIVGSSRWEY